MKIPTLPKIYEPIPILEELKNYKIIFDEKKLVI